MGFFGGQSATEPIPTQTADAGAKINWKKMHAIILEALYRYGKKIGEEGFADYIEWTYKIMLELQGLTPDQTRKEIQKNLDNVVKFTEFQKRRAR